MKYEYSVVRMNNLPKIEVLNELGDLGWRLVMALPSDYPQLASSQVLLLYFIREKVESADGLDDKKLNGEQEAVE